MAFTCQLRKKKEKKNWPEVFMAAKASQALS